MLHAKEPYNCGGDSSVHQCQDRCRGVRSRFLLLPRAEAVPGKRDLLILVGFFSLSSLSFLLNSFFSLSRSGLCNGRSYCLRADTGHERDMWIDKISREIARENARY